MSNLTILENTMGLIHETRADTFFYKSFIKPFWRKLSNSWKLMYFQNVSWYDRNVHLLPTRCKFCVKHYFWQTDDSVFIMAVHQNSNEFDLVCVCVCVVCVVCIYVYIYICICVYILCVCVCVISIYIYSVCICLCVYVYIYVSMSMCIFFVAELITVKLLITVTIYP